MIIGVAGPYSADTEEHRQKNLDAMNAAAARLLEMGHIPIIGMNAALPVVTQATVADRYKAIMDISMAVIDKCEAILLLAESPGANRERDHVASKGFPVYYSLEEIPVSNQTMQFEKEAEYIKTLLSKTDGLTIETIDAVQHYLSHNEYEMAFEGLFLDIMKGKLKPNLDYRKCVEVALALNLHNEAVFDVEFWNKFRHYMLQYKS